jgi:hypothetical protein
LSILFFTLLLKRGEYKRMVSQKLITEKQQRAMIKQKYDCIDRSLHVGHITKEVYTNG